MNMSEFTKAKSDQLNADDLIGGPIVVQVERVTKGSSEQPLNFHISGGHCPWRPCLTMRRVMLALWGDKIADYIGRWLELFRDESVKWSNKEVGGVRIGGMSHIDRDRTLNLTETRGRKKAHRIRALKAPQQSGPPTADINRIMEDNELSVDDLNAWLASKGKPTLGESEDEAVARLAGWLAGHPEAIEAMKASG